MNVCTNKFKKDVAFRPIALLGRHFDKVGKTFILMNDFFLFQPRPSNNDVYYTMGIFLCFGWLLPPHPPWDKFEICIIEENGLGKK